MDGPIIVGIDIGTTKVCTLVAREERPEEMQNFVRGDIARVAICHPSISVFPELWKGVPLFLSVERWAQQHVLK